MWTRLRSTLLIGLLVVPASLRAEQSYVGRYDVYNGFTWFDSPSVHLEERGYHLQTGLNLRTWLALGFDYSVVTGNLVLRANDLKPSLQGQIEAELAVLNAEGLLPPGYQLAVQTHSKTQTFAAGPQFEFRHFRQVTFFARPSIGAIYEVATPHASDPITQGIVSQLAPSGSKTDWEPFYGFGGGAEVNLGNHISLRFQADFVHNALFTDIFASSRNTVRLSLGPALHFGKNIAH